MGTINTGVLQSAGLKLVPSSHPGPDTPKMHMIILKLVQRSYPGSHTLKMHIMVRKLVTHSQTSPYTSKLLTNCFKHLEFQIKF